MSSSAACPVVRVVSSNPAQQGEFIEINKSDFDRDRTKYKLWQPAPIEPVAPPPPPPPVSK